MSAATTDRALLELAAKAAGISHLLGAWFDDGRQAGFLSGRLGNGRSVWNPLTDDGDALRLAVKLRVLVDVNHAAGALVMWHLRSLVEPWGDDPYAAARRAIVRAAAEIGKAMP